MVSLDVENGAAAGKVDQAAAKGTETAGDHQQQAPPTATSFARTGLGRFSRQISRQVSRSLRRPLVINWMARSYRVALDCLCMFSRRRVGVGAASARRRRRVQFVQQAAVFEFERRLFGGGGIPEDGPVSLGLGQLVGESTRELLDKEDKDVYACEGYLEAAARAKLLREWMSAEAVIAELTQYVEPMVERTRRERYETASSRQDQRRMPESEQEAILQAQQDAIIARRVASITSPRRQSVPAKSIAKKRPAQENRSPAVVPARRRRTPGVVARVVA